MKYNYLMQVLPVVNCDTEECVKNRLAQAGEFSEWMHVDVGDGKFASTVTWGTPEEWKRLITNNLELTTKFEIHLMVENPEAVIDAWLRTGAKRIIVHLEAMTDSVYILEKCKKYDVEVMLSIGPKTEVERLLAHGRDFKYFQILTVFPGMQGQKFQKDSLQKIKFIREKIPDAIIEVDGGINLETAKLVKQAGADIVVSASYIFNSENPLASYKTLLNA